jgi:transposase-like protein
MSKGVPHKTYSGKFKQNAIETMQKEGLGVAETARRFEVHRKQIQNWERVYLEEGAKGLYIERRGRGSAGKGNKSGRPPKLGKQVEEDLIAEVQRLRAENDYLKNLHALVRKKEQREKKRK